MTLNPLSTAALLIEGWALRRDDPTQPPTRVTTATGFIVDTAHAGHALVTARHVLSGENMVTGAYDVKPEYLTVRLPPARQGEGGATLQVELYDDYPTEAGRRWAEHPLGREVDVAAVPVTVPEGAPVVLLDPAQGPLTLRSFWTSEGVPPPEPDVGVVTQVTDRLFVVGWPYGDTGTWPYAVWSTGYISTEPDIAWRGLPAFLLDCRSRQGQSGAPVLQHVGPAEAVALADGDVLIHEATQTRLAGVYSGRVDRDSDLGRVFNTTAIREVLAQLPPPAGSTTAPSAVLEASPPQP